MVDPARLAWGLRAACVRLGVRIFEGTSVASAATYGHRRRRAADAVRHRVAHGRSRSAPARFPPLVRRIGTTSSPVWDYVLVTEPLTAEQLASIGWAEPPGHRRRGQPVPLLPAAPTTTASCGAATTRSTTRRAHGRTSTMQRRGDVERLADHFFDDVPAAGGRAVHPRLGRGRSTPAPGSARSGARLSAGGSPTPPATPASASGATRFGAQVMLDLLGGEPTERTGWRWCARKPIPFPPEPVRWAGIQLTRRAIARADANGGRRDLWLRTLDRLGSASTHDCPSVAATSSASPTAASCPRPWLISRGLRQMITEP